MVYSDQCREMIFNLWKFMEAEAANGVTIPLTRVYDRMRKAINVSNNTITQVKKEGEEIERGERSGWKTPNVKRQRIASITKIEPGTEDFIRKHVNNYHKIHDRYPTLDRLLLSLKDDNLIPQKTKKTSLRVILAKVGLGAFHAKKKQKEESLASSSKKILDESTSSSDSEDLDLENLPTSHKTAETNLSELADGPSIKRIRIDDEPDAHIIGKTPKLSENSFPRLVFPNLNDNYDPSGTQNEAMFNSANEPDEEDDSEVSSWCTLLSIKLKEFDDYTKQYIMKQIDDYMFQVKVAYMTREKYDQTLPVNSDIDAPTTPFERSFVSSRCLGDNPVKLEDTFVLKKEEIDIKEENYD